MHHASFLTHGLLMLDIFNLKAPRDHQPVVSGWLRPLDWLVPVSLDFQFQFLGFCFSFLSYLHLFFPQGKNKGKK